MSSSSDGGTYRGSRGAWTWAGLVGFSNVTSLSPGERVVAVVRAGSCFSARQYLSNSGSASVGRTVEGSLDSGSSNFRKSSGSAATAAAAAVSAPAPAISFVAGSECVLSERAPAPPAPAALLTLLRALAYRLPGRGRGGSTQCFDVFTTSPALCRRRNDAGRIGAMGTGIAQ